MTKILIVKKEISSKKQSTEKRPNVRLSYWYHFPDWLPTCVQLAKCTNEMTRRRNTEKHAGKFSCYSSSWNNVSQHGEDDKAAINEDCESWWAIIQKRRQYNIKKVNFVPVVRGYPKAPFSIATTSRYSGGRYSFPWITLLYPWSVP